MISDAQRGFSKEEFVQRTQSAQRLMAQSNLSALLLTTEPEVRYYTGFLTRFWESPTRPWFVVLPSTGPPIAVVPSIGSALMGQTWIEDIRTWQAPNYEDDGVALLTDALCEVTPVDGNIGIADQMESHVRMPLGDLRGLERRLGRRTLVSDQNITRQLRMIKSESEIRKIRTAARIADAAFNRVPEFAKAGSPLSHIFRAFQSTCLEEGADWIPYLAGAAGQNGYHDVISPATDTPLVERDVLMLDTGLVWDGYFCDFDRNYSVGPPTVATQKAHQQLVAASVAAFEACKPGAKVSDLFHAMNAVINPGGAKMDAGRFGHGLGMQLTEWPSIIPQDHTPLVAGMVLTLEPTIALEGGKILVHEENIVIQKTGAAYLSTPQDHQIRVV